MWIERWKDRAKVKRGIGRMGIQTGGMERGACGEWEKEERDRDMDAKTHVQKKYHILEQLARFKG